MGLRSGGHRPNAMACGWAAAAAAEAAEPQLQLQVGNSASLRAFREAGFS